MPDFRTALISFCMDETVALKSSAISHAVIYISVWELPAMWIFPFSSVLIILLMAMCLYRLTNELFH